MRKVGGWVLVVFLFSMVAGYAWAEETKVPKAVVPETEFDFKAVDEGTVLEHAFKIRNEGEAPLDILEVKTG